MLKLLSHLKENWISVVIIILILCIQAWADLELPNYTSKIVNVGIQQSGIETTNEDVIKKVEILKQLPETKDLN